MHHPRPAAADTTQPRPAFGQPGAAACDPHLVLLARRALASRRALGAVLPASVVGDHGLELLLMLFLAEADGVVMHEDVLVAGLTIGPDHGRRWIAALVQAGLAATSAGLVALSRHGSAAVASAMADARREIYGPALVP